MMETHEEQNDRLWKILKARVDERLRAEDAPRSANTPVYAKNVMLAIAIAGCYSGILLLPPSGAWLLLWAALGVATFFLIVNAAHDASHGTLFRHSGRNRRLLLGSFALLGIDGELWGLRHRTAHHPHTNVSAVDPDSVPNPFLRLSPHHPWHPWFRFQHLYAVVLYAFAFFHTAVIQDFEHLIKKPLPYLKRIRSDRKAALRMCNVKAAYLILFAAVPVLIAGLPVSAVLAGMAIQLGAASLVFVLTICLNHYVMETTFFDTGDASPDESHLLHQLRASADWHPTSKVITGLMGGANAHTAHHLFPGLSHRHYHWVSKVIIDFCDEYSLPYNSFTFLGGLRSHFRFLYTLGRRPETA